MGLKTKLNQCLRLRGDYHAPYIIEQDGFHGNVTSRDVMGHQSLLGTVCKPMNRLSYTSGLQNLREKYGL